MSYLSDSQKIILPTIRLVHYPVCPFSRTVRMVLTEKELPFSLIEEPFWEQRDSLLSLNPSGTLPIFIEQQEKHVICEVRPIVEYLEEIQSGRPLLPSSPLERAEIRRLCDWFHVKFYQEVSGTYLSERLYKRVGRQGCPDSQNMRLASEHLKFHCAYINYLLAERDWIGGYVFTLADITAAAHLSALDFLGNIPWDAPWMQPYGLVRDWYARIKSRKSFRMLLSDSVRGFSPPEYYANPDF